jgi:hypothetical protein
MTAMDPERARQVLGLAEMPDPDVSVVRRAWREKVKDAHPDHGGTPEQMADVQAAYLMLAVTTTGAASAGAAPAGAAPEDAEPEDGRVRSAPGRARARVAEEAPAVAAVAYRVARTVNWPVVAAGTATGTAIIVTAVLARAVTVLWVSLYAAGWIAYSVWHATGRWGQW